MGYQVGTICYPTQVDGLQAVCNANYPRIRHSQLGTSPISETCSVQSLQLYIESSQGAPYSVPVTLQQCVMTDDYADTSQLFGLILLAVLGVYLIKLFVFRLVTNQ